LISFLNISNIARSFADFIYPPVCSTCWRNLARGESYICHYCWDGFERVAPTESMIQVIEGKFLADQSVDKIESVFLFEQDPRVRIAIHLLKYAGAENIAERLGIFIAKKIAGDQRLSMSSMIVPIPLHAARKRERGYNQSELIANSIGRELRIQHEPRLLLRTRQTQTQTMFDAEGRKKNIAGAFSIGRNFSEAVGGKSILLIDDVITTGSTIKECAKVLKENGAGAVYAASAAITI
jgi:ComF family protein